MTADPKLKLAPKDNYPAGRIPPHASEAEEAVLGGVMLDNDSMSDALEVIRADDFYRAANRSIFEAMSALSEKREPIDILTLGTQLRQLGALEACGGMDALTRLASAVPSSANVGYYARVVKEMSVRRKIIHEASTIISEAFNTEGEVEGFLDSTEQRILSLSDYRVNPSFSEISGIVRASLKLIEDRIENKNELTGVTTGFKDLNNLTAGFQPSDLIIIAARPSMGKTALALNMAQRVALGSGQNVAVFSLEMSKEQLVLRILCAEALVDNSRIRRGNLEGRNFSDLVNAAGKISDAPLFIDDTPALTITELRAKTRRLHREHPLALVVIDYLQLLRSPAYSKNREQEISDISRSLKALAKELHVPVIALSQLNRSVESRENKRPVMSDLRESGAIEQDADIIMFIYRDEVYNPDTTEDKNIAEIIIGKHRNGPTGDIRLNFRSELTRFDDLDESHDEPIPVSKPELPIPTLGEEEEDGKPF